MTKNYKCWPDGWPKTLNYPEMPVYGFLDQTAARVPDRIAVIFGGMELTYGELRELSNRFAAALQSLGVSKGDRVAVYLPNAPQFAVAYYGLLKAGAVFTPVSPLLSAEEVKKQLCDSGAETLVVLDLLYPNVMDILSSTPVTRVITTSIADCYSAVISALKPLGKFELPGTLDMAALLKEHEPLAEPVAIDAAKDLAHIAYTGGTTGVSKGVMLTHRSVVASVLQFACWMGGTSVEFADGVLRFLYPGDIDPARDRLLVLDKETALVVVPWFHSMGTIAYLNGNVVSGITMVLYPRFDAREYVGGVEKYRATVLGGAPQLFVPIVNLPDFHSYDLSGVRVVGSGSAPLPVVILEEMLNAISGVVCEAYGLSECTLAATMNPPFRSGIKVGSVGLPLFDTECKVVDVSTGEDLPAGMEGEICIRGPQVMLGYWRKPEESEGVLENGWLHTGDIGREDEDGYFFITDRKKDMIIYKGYNVYPREVEEILHRHPAVRQCAVVGKADPKGGEVPVAFVELKEGETAGAAEVMDFVNKQMAYYKKVREVIFLEQIPMSGIGKILKKDLRKMLENNEA
ncbi:MAG TPA: AMP-binding protein [Syntrophales bacterium]|nr:AMP-binding protein [Syntrophales bacterium]HQN77186.1 AMP-binding protein [Syntrophales bacterium]HQQ25947.1 AMP-binding protein [Syntrophales bacterium]